jgi:hypothetical protein
MMIWRRAIARRIGRRATLGASSALSMSVGDGHAELASIVLVENEHDGVIGVIGERPQLMASAIERQQHERKLASHLRCRYGVCGVAAPAPPERAAAPLGLRVRGARSVYPN